MHWFVFLLIEVGISLDIFGEMSCKGAQLGSVNKKRTVLLALLVAAWQTAVLGVGVFFGDLLHDIDMKANASSAIGLIVATAVYIILGVRMLIKGKKDGVIEEHRVDIIPYSAALHLSIMIIGYTLLSGFALGFLTNSYLVIFPMLACITFLVVLIGTFVGYRFGYSMKNKVYVIGGVCLLAASAWCLVYYVIH